MDFQTMDKKFCVHESSELDSLLHRCCRGLSAVAVGYQIIDSAPGDRKAALLQSLICGYRRMEVSGQESLPEIISEEENRAYLSEHKKMVDTFLDDLTGRGLSEEEFYERLWNFIRTLPYLHGEKDRIMALFQCVQREDLPYFFIDEEDKVSMSDQVYRFFSNMLGEQMMARVKFILDRESGLQQKTEQASAILSMMESLSGTRMKVVFLAQIMGYYHALIRLSRGG